MAHYSRWDKQRKAMPEDHRDGYDARLIEEGYLLPSRRGGRPVSDDVFADIAAEFLGLPSVEAAQHVARKSTRKPSDQKAADLVDQAEKVQGDLAKKPAKKALKKKRAR